MAGSTRPRTAPAARAWVVRRQPPVPPRRVLLAGLGGALAIAVLALAAESSGLALLAAALGSSCVLIFTVPDAPFSQPVNVVAGHVLSSAWGLVVATVLPTAWWSIGIAVGLAIATMAALRLTHPPAGADPIVVMTAGAAWGYLLVPMLLGTLLVVAVGVVFHRLTGTAYPRPD